MRRPRPTDPTTSDDSPAPTRWRIHLESSPERLYRFLATADGRAKFWAAKAPGAGEEIEFRFPDGQTLESEIVEAVPARRFVVTYFGGNRVAFRIGPDGDGGSVLTLEENGPSRTHLADNRCGWVTVLLTLKAAADFGVDLRNHDPERSWSRGFVDV